MTFHGPEISASYVELPFSGDSLAIMARGMRNVGHCRKGLQITADDFSESLGLRSDRHLRPHVAIRGRQLSETRVYEPQSFCTLTLSTLGGASTDNIRSGGGVKTQASNATLWRPTNNYDAGTVSDEAGVTHNKHNLNS